MTKLPEGTLIIDSFPEYDYLDVYSFKVKSDKKIDPGDVAELLCTEGPQWADTLLKIRNSVVKYIGLETGEGIDWRKAPSKENRQPGKRFGIFEVKEIRDDEFMMGGEDKHLDFRVSAIVRPKDGYQEVFIATIVKFNNILGNLYFFPVKPFHCLIVKDTVKRMEKKILTQIYTQV